MGFFKKKTKGPLYTVELGSASDFVHAYKDQKNSMPTNNVVLISSNNRLLKEKCLVPTIKRGTSSFVIYDDGIVDSGVFNALKARGYDVQVIDFADQTHKSRIDVFEMVNITKNTFWTAEIFANELLDIQEEKRLIVQQLLKAMLDMMVEHQQTVTIKRLWELFRAICANNQMIINEMMKYVDFESAYPMCKDDNDLLKNIEETIMFTSMSFCNNPNVYGITSLNRNMAFIFRNATKNYRHITTLFMANLNMLSSISGNGHITTVVFDKYDVDWYDRSVLQKIEKSTMMSFDKHVVNVKIKKTIDENDQQAPLIIYMLSDDEKTIETIHSYITLNALFTEEEKQELSKKHFKKKPLPESVLNDAPFTIEQLKEFNGFITIDTSKKTKPFLMGKVQESE